MGGTLWKLAYATDHRLNESFVSDSVYCLLSIFRHKLFIDIHLHWLYIKIDIVLGTSWWAIASCAFPLSFWGSHFLKSVPQLLHGYETVACLMMNRRDWLHICQYILLRLYNNYLVLSSTAWTFASNSVAASPNLSIAVLSSSTKDLCGWSVIVTYAWPPLTLTGTPWFDRITPKIKLLSSRFLIRWCHQASFAYKLHY